MGILENYGNYFSMRNFDIHEFSTNFDEIIYWIIIVPGYKEQEPSFISSANWMEKLEAFSTIWMN